MKQKGTVRIGSFWGPFNQIHRFRGGGVTSDKEVYILGIVCETG